MRKKAIPRIDVPMEELEKVLERARKEPLDEEGYAKLKASLETLGYLVQLVENKDTTIHRLRQMLFGSSTEKTSQVLPTEGVARQAGNPTVNPKVPKEKTSEEKSKGHGRNGAEAYSGAEKVRVVHESLKPGDRCPHCQKGKVYHQAQPGVLVRVVGQAALKATVYELEKLRCNLCTEVFTAKAPEGVGAEKYDETSASMIALLKYGSGLPFHRLERLQGCLGIPLPAATQWEIVKEITGVLKPAYQELIRQAAQGEVVHNDDTTMKILTMMPARSPTEECAVSFSASSCMRATCSCIWAACCINLSMSKEDMFLAFPFFGVECLLEELEDPLLAGRLVIGRRRLARLAELEGELETAAGDVVERVGEERRVLRLLRLIEMELRGRRERECERVAVQLGGMRLAENRRRRDPAALLDCRQHCVRPRLLEIRERDVRSSGRRRLLLRL